MRLFICPKVYTGSSSKLRHTNENWVYIKPDKGVVFSIFGSLFLKKLVIIPRT